MTSMEEVSKRINDRKKDVKKLLKDKSASPDQLREARKKVKRAQRKLASLKVEEGRRQKLAEATAKGKKTEGQESVPAE